MKRHFIFFILLLHAIGFSAQHELYCDPKLMPILEKVQQLPEASAVIDQVLCEGPLTIKINRELSSEFDGYWSSHYRTIYITPNRSECTQITALLMELHNALRTCDIEHMYSLAQNRSIGRKQFIRDFEYIEYENALEAKRLVEIGAKQGLFPHNCRFNIADNFLDHLDVQYSQGHSASIGRIYDQLTF
ncbi:MAG: hypothetical protein JSS30_02735 [Verrucomicrobia bacterium]|nr:hypothetical protein [Verrucomicrobiota bacterium]